MNGESRSLAVVILAAGQGTRMKSRLAKVLHPIAGRPMLGYPLATAEGLDPERIVVVVGRDADAVREAFAGRAEFALQAEQRGTGHAVLEAQAALTGFEGDLLVLYGDTPLLRPETLSRMRETKAASGADLVLLSAQKRLSSRPLLMRGDILLKGNPSFAVGAGRHYCRLEGYVNIVEVVTYD